MPASLAFVFLTLATSTTAFAGAGTKPPTLLPAQLTARPGDAAIFTAHSSELLDPKKLSWVLLDARGKSIRQGGVTWPLTPNRLLQIDIATRCQDYLPAGKYRVRLEYRAAQSGKPQKVEAPLEIVGEPLAQRSFHATVQPESNCCDSRQPALRFEIRLENAGCTPVQVPNLIDSAEIKIAEIWGAEIQGKAEKRKKLRCETAKPGPLLTEIKPGETVGYWIQLSKRCRLPAPQVDPTRLYDIELKFTDPKQGVEIDLKTRVGHRLEPHS